EAAFGRCHVAQSLKEVFTLLWRQMGHRPDGLLSRQRCPVPFDNAGAPFERTDRTSATGVTIQAARDSNWTCRAVVCRVAPQLLLDVVKIFRQLRGLPATVQEVVKVIHGGRIAGHEALALPCWHEMLLCITASRWEKTRYFRGALFCQRRCVGSLLGLPSQPSICGLSM